MPQLVVDCPRCDAKRMSFNVLSAVVVGQNYNWQHIWEAFCVCRHCHRGTIFVLVQQQIDQAMLEPVKKLLNIDGAVNDFARPDRFVNISDNAAIEAPEFLPEDVLAAFNEGAKCMAVGCYNAAGTMFRLCIDHTSRDKLPAGNDNGLNHKVRRDLGLRLPWLFDNGLLPEDLRELSSSVREDGNDGAHQGTLTKHDALDLLDFSTALVTRIYTEPERVRLAKERRDARRTA